MELAVIGGGALLLSGLHIRPTEDIDVVALKDGDWQRASPLPADVITFVRDVGRAHDLPVKRAGSGVDWLNAAASFLMPDDLPPGFFERTKVQTFGGLAIHVPSTWDLLALKVLSASRPGRGNERQRDIQDLVILAPDGAELARALGWASTRPPMERFWSTRGRPLLDQLAAAGLQDAVDHARAMLDLEQDEP